ncbi:sucrose-phosphate synthase [Kosmotoga arenicorallina S304]|uniref:sucrose-phosphate synthase n=1 Tax=Kosmotoga arenicorallina S304 TaxID=1453497 RepID=A0A176K112_9BACT|nr:glycosyltransferase [Kosmotoga arenicorallina]OAA30727.1 sucrose-phosphate synthase [Kosmotoga arenicorallina S304]
MKIAFLNPQGNFDPLDSYWTDHPDFGGQLVYVKELAIAMASLGVDVDIVTRRIADKRWPEFSTPFDYYDGIDRVRIVRISFGGNDFLPKEKLWKHIKDYVRGIKALYEREGSFPDFFTGHYADGGLSAAMLTHDLKIPFSFTAHSLGAQKMDKLGVSRENFREIDRIYRFSYRIPAERISMKYSVVNFVSTSQERFDQYSHQLYKNWVDVYDDSKFAIANPGVNTRIFNPMASELDHEIADRYNFVVSSYAPSRIENPVIVSSSRLDRKKNVTGLLKAFLSDRELNEKANLLIVVKGVSNAYNESSKVSGESGKILRELIKIVDSYHARDRVFFMDISSQKELAALYRMASSKIGLFAIVSLYEPFGLAPLEAMACGLPAVTTKNGGPSEFMVKSGNKYGILVDPEDIIDIARGLKKLIFDKALNRELSKKIVAYVEKNYSWRATALTYLKVIEEKRGFTHEVPEIPAFFLGRSDPPSLL